MGMRRTLKILHSLASCGLIGGLAVYMLLLLVTPASTPLAYAELREAIAAISNYILLPSLAIALITGLLAMVVHKPFMDKRWAWLKAALGLLMFKGVLTVIGAKADSAAVVARDIANGAVASDALNAALVQEWYTLAAVMALSIANVVLGVWRPKLKKRPQARDTKVDQVSTSSWVFRR